MDIKLRTGISTPNRSSIPPATGQTSGTNSVPERASGNHQLGGLVGRSLPPTRESSKAGMPPRMALPPLSITSTPRSFSQDAAGAMSLVKALLPPLTVDSAMEIPMSNMTPLTELQGALDGLRAECAAAGAPDTFEQLAAALTKVGNLPELAAKAHSPEERDAAIALLQLNVESAKQAIGPGRDGAALITLYGQNAALDSGIDKLRTHAATRMLEAQGAGEAAAPQAKNLVKQERSIAEKRLEVQRLLAKEAGFAPPLGTLRIDSALLEGLARANPAAIRRAGILLGAVLAEQQQLATSGAAKTMREAMQAMQAGSTPLSKQDANYFKQRIAALAEQPLATGLPAETLARLKLGDASAEEVIAIVKGLAARGLSGTAEVEQLVGAAGRTFDQLEQSRARLDKLDETYQLNVDAERGNVLSSGLLRHASGNAALDLGSAANVRQALAGPGAPLASLAKGQVGESLAALGRRYAEISSVEAAEQSQSVVLALDGFSTPPNPVDIASIEQSVAQMREEAKSVLAERQRLMGPEVSAALENTLRAAVLLTRPNALKPSAADGGVKAKIGDVFKKVGQGIQSGLMAKTENEFHAEAVAALLGKWGIDAAAVAPEIQQVLQQPLDTARLDQWFNSFTPTGAVKDRWNADVDSLATRLQPGGAEHLASASLARFNQAVDILETGTRLAWNLSTQTGATIPLGSLAPSLVAGLPVMLNAGLDKNSQILASRDADGYQLVLRSGTAMQGGLSLTLGKIDSLLNLQGFASVSARTHRLDGVALRFPDTDTGRQAMKDLLQRVQTQGGLETKDLLSAEQVLPVVEQLTSANANIGARLDLELPFTGAALSSSVRNDTLNAAPRLEATLSAGMQSVQSSAANSRQQVRSSESTYTIDVTALPQARLGFTVQSESGLAAKLGLGNKLSDASLTSGIPLPGASKPIPAKFECKVATQDVRENGLVSGTTERSVRVSGPSALMTSAVGQVGGDQLHALAAHLKDSPDPAHQALHQRMADLLKTTAAGEEVRVVWRIDPKAQERANALLERARSASAGRGGQAPSAEALRLAEQLEAQAQSALADPASYRLHALEKIATEQTRGKLSGLFDGGYVDLSYVKHGKEAQGKHERTADTLVFDAALLDVAMNRSKTNHISNA